MVPPLFVVKWYQPNREYKPVEKILEKEPLDVTLVCQRKKIPVRRKMLFELMGYFQDKLKRDENVYSKNTHEIDIVELDMLRLVLKFIRNGKVKLQQDEYVPFAEAVLVLEPRPTYRLEDDDIRDILIISLKESTYTRHIQNLHPRNGDILVECEETFTYIHPIVASLFSGELKKKVQAAKTARERVIISDIMESTYYAIQYLIYGGGVEMESTSFFFFCKMLEKYDVKYVGVASDAPNLPDLTPEQLEEIRDGEIEREELSNIDDIWRIPVEGRRKIVQANIPLQESSRPVSPLSLPGTSSTESTHQGTEYTPAKKRAKTEPELSLLQKNKTIQLHARSPIYGWIDKETSDTESSSGSSDIESSSGSSDIESSSGSSDIESSPGPSRPSVENLPEILGMSSSEETSDTSDEEEDGKIGSVTQPSTNTGRSRPRAASSQALDLPPSDIDPSPGPSSLSVGKLEDVPKTHNEQARIGESQLESGDSTSGASPASTHSETASTHSETASTHSETANMHSETASTHCETEIASSIHSSESPSTEEN